MVERKQIVALLAAAVAVGATVSLGHWQSRRGDIKQAMLAEWAAAQNAPPAVIDPASLPELARALPRRVMVTGTFVPQATVYLDNRLRDGVAGFYVVTPLQIGLGAPWVLVNRGWVARDASDRNRLPQLVELARPVTVEGLALKRVPRLLDLGSAPEPGLPGIWQNLDYDAFERASGQAVARLVVQQTNDIGDGLRRDWPPPALGIDKHRGYALQWYGLALTVVVLAIISILRSRVRR